MKKIVYGMCRKIGNKYILIVYRLHAYIYPLKEVMEIKVVSSRNEKANWDRSFKELLLNRKVRLTLWDIKK